MNNSPVGKNGCWPFQKCIFGGEGSEPLDRNPGKETDRQDSNRVKFNKRVNKVEPVYLEHTGTFLQRSYVSFLSMSSDEDEEAAIKNFVEKFVANTIRQAMDRYIKDTM